MEMSSAEQKMKTKNEVIKKVSGYHLVIRVEDQRISFFAYRDTHQLFQSFSEKEIIDQFKLFQTVQDLYQCLKDESQDTYRLEQQHLYFAIPIGKKRKEIKISLFQSQMPNEKAVKIKLKNACYQFNRITAEIEAVEKRIEQRIKQNESLSDKKTQLTKMRGKLQRFMQQSKERTQEMMDSYKKSEEALKTLEQGSLGLQTLLENFKSKRISKSILFSNK